MNFAIVNFLQEQGLYLVNVDEENIGHRSTGKNKMLLNSFKLLIAVRLGLSIFHSLAEI